MKKKETKNPHIGSSFDSFLKEAGIYEEVQITAIKNALSLRIKQEMEKNNISQSEMAKKMHTSRAVVGRLLDPKNISVTLSTLNKVAIALGNELEIQFRKK